MMETMNNRTYLTLRDIVETSRDMTDLTFPTSSDIVYLFEAFQSINPTEFNYVEQVAKFLQYVAESTWNNYYCYYDNEEEKNIEMSKMLLRITSYINKTENKYGLVIKLYKENEAKLMDKLATISNTKINDTPQDGGDFTTDNYVSNASETKTESDTNTIINRLNEIRSKYRDLYNDWLNDFIKKFVIFN